MLVCCEILRKSLSLPSSLLFVNNIYKEQYLLYQLEFHRHNCQISACVIQFLPHKFSFDACCSYYVLPDLFLSNQHLLCYYLLLIGPAIILYHESKREYYVLLLDNQVEFVMKLTCCTHLFIFLQALQFLGLLSAACCKYMPFMIVDQQMVLNDLPVTLVSLLADQNWNAVAETVVSHFFSSTERIYDWSVQIADGSYIPDSQPIDGSENHMAVFLLQVMHHTCVLLKSYLPLDKQLRLASMVIT